MTAIAAVAAPAPAPRHQDRRFALGLTAVAAGALVLRVVLVLTVGRRNPDGGDPLYYHVQANLLAAGHGFAEPFTWLGTRRLVPTAIHPPLFSVFLAVPSLVGLDTFLAHKLASVAAGVGTVVVVGLVARRLAGPAAGLLAAGLAALHPNLWVIEGTLMPESLGALLVAVVLLAAYRYVDDRSPRRAVVLGVAIGLAALTRAEGIGLVVLLGAPLVLLADRPVRDRARDLALLTLTVVLVVAPWAVRNLLRFDRPVLLSSNGDEVLGNANCDLTWYGEQTGFWSLGCYAPDPPAGDESVRARFYRDAGLDYVGDHLGRLPVVALARLGRVWDVWRPAQNVDLSTVEGRDHDAARLGQLAYYGLVPLALIGAVVLHRRGVPVSPFVALVALTSLTAVYAYGVIRFRVPAEVGLVVLAGVALDAGLRRWRGVA